MKEEGEEEGAGTEEEGSGESAASVAGAEGTEPSPAAAAGPAEGLPTEQLASHSMESNFPSNNAINICNFCVCWSILISFCSAKWRNLLRKSVVLEMNELININVLLVGMDWMPAREEERSEEEVVVVVEEEEG